MTYHCRTLYISFGVVSAHAADAASIGGAVSSIFGNVELGVPDGSIE